MSGIEGKIVDAIEAVEENPKGAKVFALLVILSVLGGLALTSHLP